MKAHLYWTLANRTWHFHLEPLNLDFNDDGTEYHGEYEISLSGAKLARNCDDDLMIEYDGELHDLHATQSATTANEVKPFIWSNNGGRIYLRSTKVD